MNDINGEVIVDNKIDRKNEILDVAEKLFSIKGYEKCTINHILAEVGIAKGTFYYYFKSKEEVLDSIINRVTKMVVERANSVAENPELTSVEKVLNVIFAMNVDNDLDNQFMERLHKPENALIHQKSMVLMVNEITPILKSIVLEGINKGEFISEFPKEYIQIFLSASMTLLDDGIFHKSKREQASIIMALVSLLDKILGVKDGTFWDVAKYHF